MKKEHFSKKLLLALLVVAFVSCQQELADLDQPVKPTSVENPYALTQSDALAEAGAFIRQMAEAEGSVGLRALATQSLDYEVKATTQKVLVPSSTATNAPVVEQAVPIYTIQYKDERGQSAGSIVTIGDERVAEKVIAFSESGQLDLFNGEMADFWQDRIAGYIHYALNQPEKEQQKLQLRSGTQLASIQHELDVFGNRWKQDAPFNRYVPFRQIGEKGPYYKSKVGCVAVAMGQIMAHHQWPLYGATRFYSKDVEYRNFTFEDKNYYYKYWDVMTQRTLNETGKDMVAKLLVEIGYKVQMNYGVNVSTTNGFSGCVAVFNQMGYFCNQNFKNYNYMVFPEIYQDIVFNRRPALMGASRNKSLWGGWHMFVIAGVVTQVSFHEDGTPFDMQRPLYLGINDGSGGSKNDWYRHELFYSEIPASLLPEYNREYPYRYGCMVLNNIRPNPNNKGSFDYYRYRGVPDVFF